MTISALLIPVKSDTGPVQLNLQVHTTLQLSAEDVRRIINRKLIPELGTGLIAGIPEVVILDKDVRWRVPIILSLPQLGTLGQVGQVDVDPQSGERLLTPEQREQILQHTSRLYAGATLQAR